MVWHSMDFAVHMSIVRLSAKITGNMATGDLCLESGG
jgi:hypothetical protein